MPPASIVARNLGPLRDRLEALGIDSDRLLRARGVDPGTLDRDDFRLPVAVSDRIWTDAAIETGDPDFALHLAESIEPRSFGVLTYILGSSATVGEAFHRLAQHFAVVSSASGYRLERDGEEARLLVEMPELDRRARHARQSIEFLVATAYCFNRTQCVEPWSASTVWFPHVAPASVDEHRRIFAGATIVFGAPRCGYAFDRQALEIPLRRSDPRLLEILERHAHELRRGTASGELQDRLRAALSAALADGSELGTDTLARTLGVSTRTLRRQLASAGTSFSEVLDQLRQEMAINLLDSDSPPVEVAHALAFSDLRALNRAFRRWFGITPIAYRNTRDDR